MIRKAALAIAAVLALSMPILLSTTPRPVLGTAAAGVDTAAEASCPHLGLWAQVASFAYCGGNASKLIGLTNFPSDRTSK